MLSLNKETKIRNLWGPERELRDVTLIIIHGTSKDLVNKKSRIDKEKTCFHIKEFYKRGKIGPHFLIDWEGDVYQLLPLSRVAWHLRIREDSWQLYRSSEWRENIWLSSRMEEARIGTYDWWDKRWGASSPLDLWHPALRRPGDAQYRSIGIELIPKNGNYQEEQYIALANLILFGLMPWLSIPLITKELRKHLMGGEDVHPITKTTFQKGGWDPGPNFDWDGVMGLLEEGTTQNPFLMKPDWQPDLGELT